MTLDDALVRLRTLLHTYEATVAPVDLAPEDASAIHFVVAELERRAQARAAQQLASIYRVDL